MGYISGILYHHFYRIGYLPICIGNSSTTIEGILRARLPKDFKNDLAIWKSLGRFKTLEILINRNSCNIQGNMYMYLYIFR